MSNAPLIDCDTATPAELAAAMISYVEEFGWTKGWLGEPDGPVCLVGALGAVCEGDPSLGYKVCNGTTGATDDNGKLITAAVSDGVLRLALALETEGTINAETGRALVLRYGYAAANPSVNAGIITEFNDTRTSVQEALAPLRRIISEEMTTSAGRTD